MVRIFTTKNQGINTLETFKKTPHPNISGRYLILEESSDMCVRCMDTAYGYRKKPPKIAKNIGTGNPPCVVPETFWVRKVRPFLQVYGRSMDFFQPLKKLLPV